MVDQKPDHGEEKLEPGTLTTNSRVLKWLDNFWYHYKWHTIITLFVAVVVIVGVVQMVSRPKYDSMLVYAGSYRMSEEEKAAFDKLLSDICPEDFDGNGEKNINFVMYQVYSSEEMQSEKESVEASGGEYYYNAQFFAEEQKSFIFFTQTGEGAACLVSPYMYGVLAGESRLRSMKDLYPEGDLPTGTTDDGYGVTLGKIDFYIYHPDKAGAIPQDMILCLLKPTLNADETGYARSEAFFRAIVDYRVNP